MPYAYTLSGSTKKFESSEWTSYWKGTTGTLTGPDTTGYYTVTPPTGLISSTESNTTSYLLTIYHGINNWFYFKEEDKPKTVYLFVNHSSNNAYLHYYRKIYHAQDAYLFASAYQKYEFTINPGSAEGIFNLHAFRNYKGNTYTLTYGSSNKMPFNDLKYADAEDGKIYNLEINHYNVVNYNVENKPIFSWDPAYNIISFTTNVKITDYIYYNGSLLRKDIEIRDYSESAGYLRFHFYLNGELQTSPIDESKVKFSKSIKQYIKTYPPTSYIDTTPLAEDYYNNDGVSYTYVLPDDYVMS